jgi:hypothetical protein
LEAAGEAEEVVVEVVRRRGGGRETTILGDDGDGFIDVVVVEIAAEVEGRGRRHLAAETPKRQEARGKGTESLVHTSLTCRGEEGEGERQQRACVTL